MVVLHRERLHIQQQEYNFGNNRYQINDIDIQRLPLSARGTGQSGSCLVELSPPSLAVPDVP